MCINGVSDVTAASNFGAPIGHWLPPCRVRYYQRMADPLPNFAYFVEQLPDEEIEAICTFLSRNERDYATMLGGLTKFRPITIRTKVSIPQQRIWFRKFSQLKPEFAPVWLLAYGTEILMPIEKVALATLPISLRDQLGYEAKEGGPTADEIVTFLKTQEAEHGTSLARQWGNMFLLLMDPASKAPIAEALDQLGWNLSTPPVEGEVAARE